MEDSNRFRWASSWTTSGDLAGINSANLSGVINSASICQPDVLNISGSTSISLHENIWKSLDPPTSLVCWDETLFYIPAAFRFFGGWWVSMTMDHTSLCFRGEKKRKQVLQVLHILKLEGGAYGLMNFDPQSWDKPRVWPQPCLYSMSLCSRALQDHQTDHPGSAADPWLQHQSKSSQFYEKKNYVEPSTRSSLGTHDIPMISPFMCIQKVWISQRLGVPNPDVLVGGMPRSCSTGGHRLTSASVNRDS